VRRRASPPVVTLVVLALLFGATALLGVSASTGSRESLTFITSVPWLVWKVVGALALIVFAALFVQALQILRNAPECGLNGSRERAGRYLIAAGFVVVAIAAVIVLAGGEPDIPVSGLVFRTRAVLFAGMLTSIPWLALVWLAHAECHDLEDGLTGAVKDPPAPQHSLAVVNARLLLLWKLLTACVTAFAVTVVAAIVNFGSAPGQFPGRASGPELAVPSGQRLVLRRLLRGHPGRDNNSAGGDVASLRVQRRGAELPIACRRPADGGLVLGSGSAREAAAPRSSAGSAIRSPR